MCRYLDIYLGHGLAVLLGDGLAVLLGRTGRPALLPRLLSALLPGHHWQKIFVSLKNIWEITHLRTFAEARTGKPGEAPRHTAAAARPGNTASAHRGNAPGAPLQKYLVLDQKY